MPSHLVTYTAPLAVTLKDLSSIIDSIDTFHRKERNLAVHRLAAALAVLVALRAPVRLALLLIERETAA
jgi:hypothetical protein